MSTNLSVYCKSAFKEFLLPAVNNANSSIILAKGVFGLNQDLEIPMEVIEHKWSFISSDRYTLTCDNASVFERDIKDGDLIKLCIGDMNLISILVRESDSYFSVYDKYDISRLSEPVTIGSNENNMIVYGGGGLVSGLHACIRNSESGLIVEDQSKNGTFVNNHRIQGSEHLRFGDCIDIYGLRIVVLGCFLAISTSYVKVTIDTGKLSPCVLCAPKINDSHIKSSKRVFHRAPRLIPKIDTEPIEIDGAPDPKELEQPSMLMTIGPAMTMALPMLLGCGLAIFASRSSGSSSGLFMYTGLVTAVASGLLGTIWALVSMKNAKKKFEKEQQNRSIAYGEYLNKCDAKISVKYKKNGIALSERYSSALECCRYDADNPCLWNRNDRQEDFLKQRIGIGSVPFQANVVVPKEKFMMLSDALVEMPGKIKEKYSMLHDVPVCVDLLHDKLVGVIGGREKRGAVLAVQNMIAQIAANNCYTDVKILMIYDERETDLSGSWDFVKWLPHVWNETKTFRYIAGNKEDASEVFYELTKILRMRAEKQHQENDSEKMPVPKPYYILFLADPEMLEGELISKYVFDPKPAYGLSTIVLAENYEDLPNECEKIIENDQSFSGVYNVYDDQADRTSVQFDPITSDELEAFARKIANVEVHETEAGGDIPNSLSFFDMYGIRSLSQLNVLDRWRKNRTYESMKAMIGQKAGGAPCFLDIHEKYHGPHGLVAGTTGSGKSETLQTYILSLAVNFSPDDVGFFVIDYKGGGMANLFSSLPHLIGQISNLSGNQVRRAMVSIKSENVRRQRIFNEYGVNNINSYTKLYKNNEAKMPVPHMLIIIDEFAELKREEPEFMRELISVAQVGRSLGVHLILATQKPSGTVDDKIWSNTKFRLCLRVQDRQDSSDMLHRPDAAYITQAGRCYLQVGNDELFELFQSGWSGAEYSEDPDDARYDIAKIISLDGRASLEGSRTKILKKEKKRILWISMLIPCIEHVLEGEEDVAERIENGTVSKTDLCKKVFDEIIRKDIDLADNESNEKRIIDLIGLYMSVVFDKDIDTLEEKAKAVIDEADKIGKKLPDRKEKTQLDAVVEYLQKTAADNGFVQTQKLWLPVLPTSLYLDQLKGYRPQFDGKEWPVHKGEWSLAVPTGMYDDPENQEQGSYIVDLAQTGNIAVCGIAASGKSTFVQTFIFSLINHYTPGEINIYAIDFSSKMLSVFEGEPHVGAVMYENDDELIDKFFAMMKRIMDERKEMFRGGSYSQYIRSKGKTVLPAILIAIDNFSNFKTKTTDKYDDLIIQLAKEGVNNGIFLMVTAAGFSSGEIQAKLADNMRTPVCLEMTDRFQYSEIMRCMHLGVRPEENVKGRGLAHIGEAILEFQTALPLQADDDFKRGEALKSECAKMREAWHGQCARKIPVIPAKPTWKEFSENDEKKTMDESDRMLPIGYNKEDASIYGIDLSRMFTYIIAGKAATGKTNMLKTLMMSANDKGGDIVIFDFESEFEDLADKIGAERITTDKEMYDLFVKLTPELKARSSTRMEIRDRLNKAEDSDADLDNEEIFKEMKEKHNFRYMFIGNMISFMKKVYKPEDGISPMNGYIENIIGKGELLGVYWFACYDHDKDTNGDASGRTAYSVFAKNKTGIHFGGNTGSQSVLPFDSLSFSEGSKPQKTGIGMIPPENGENTAIKVVIPFVKG